MRPGDGFYVLSLWCCLMDANVEGLHYCPYLGKDECEGNDRETVRNRKNGGCFRVDVALNGESLTDDEPITGCNRNRAISPRTDEKLVIRTTWAGLVLVSTQCKACTKVPSIRQMHYTIIGAGDCGWIPDKDSVFKYDQNGAFYYYSSKRPWYVYKSKWAQVLAEKEQLNNRTLCDWHSHRIKLVGMTRNEIPIWKAYTGIGGGLTYILITACVGFFEFRRWRKRNRQSKLGAGFGDSSSSGWSAVRTHREEDWYESSTGGFYEIEKQEKLSRVSGER